MAQLSTAVRTTCVDATILQQEHCVLPSTGHVLQSPATEHMTDPWLRHGVPLQTNTQLSVFCIPPTQHVGEGRGGVSTYPKRQRVMARQRKTKSDQA